MAAKLVSVIIPVYRNLPGLERCLEALDRQRCGPDRFEVLVVNNDPAETLRVRVRPRYALRVIEESRRGSYAARNAGVRAASGQILAFTDSDCSPLEDWIERGASRLEREGADALVAGRIRQTAANPERPRWVEWYDLICYLDQESYVIAHGTAATANVWAWPAAFTRSGAYDEALRTLGDYEWGRRAARAGYRWVYDESVCVEHRAADSVGVLTRRALSHAAALRRLAATPGRGLNGEACRSLRTFGRLWSCRRAGIAGRLGVLALELWVRSVLCFERSRLALIRSPR